MLSRPPDARGPFLTTEQIIRQYQQAERRSWQPALHIQGWVRTALRATIALGAVAAAAWFVRPYLDAQRPWALARGVPAAPQPAQVAPLPSPASDMAPPVDTALPAAVTSAMPSAAPAATPAYAVEVVVARRPASIFVDGRRAVMGRRWQGELQRGQHVIMVRYGNRSLQETLNVRDEALQVRFDVQRRSVQVQPRAASPQP